MNEKYFRKLEEMIAQNTVNRGLKGAWVSGQLKKASQSLMMSDSIGILTGFYVKEAHVGETDGPLGAVGLAKTLEKMDKKVVLITDSYSENILKQCILANGVKASIEVASDDSNFCNKIMNNYDLTHIVSIERPGRAKDGHCYSMRGEDITAFVPNTDYFFNQQNKKVTTIGIGDGGNELGMGNIYDLIKRNVPLGGKIGAVQKSDYLIIAGVSNWGAHALSAGLSILTQKMLLHDESMEKNLIYAMVKAGGVDGCSKKREYSVDGLDLKVHQKMVSNMRKVIHTAIMVQSYELKSS